MSKRNRVRKERKEQEKLQVRAEMKERYLAETAGIRRIGKIAGYIGAGALVAVILFFGGRAIYKTLPGVAAVTGPFGSIKKTELEEGRFVTLETTQGNIKVEVNTKDTPKTAANFVTLAKRGFYDGTKFHRVLKGFMIQGGDPNSKDDEPANDGTGSPGYTFADEKFEGEYTRGVLAMANSGPNTNGSQFFIMHADNELPKDYVIFGRVVEGMEIVDKIAEAEVVDNGQGEPSRPASPVVITKVSTSAN